MEPDVPLDQLVKVGQRWRRKADGVMVTVVRCRTLAFDDWKIRRDDSRHQQNIYGFNLNKLYELVQDVD